MRGHWLEPGITGVSGRTPVVVECAPIELLDGDAETRVALLRVGNVNGEQVEHRRDVCHNHLGACVWIRDARGSANEPSMAKAMPRRPVPAPNSSTRLFFQAPGGNALDQRHGRPTENSEAYSVFCTYCSMSQHISHTISPTSPAKSSLMRTFLPHTSNSRSKSLLRHFSVCAPACRR